MKILVVDDEPTIRRIAGKLLTSAGYHVLKAQDGEQALVLAHNERPNLIVLDLVMPGLAGYEVVQGIRRNPFITDTPILIMHDTAGPGNAAAQFLQFVKNGLSRRRELTLVNWANRREFLVRN